MKIDKDDDRYEPTITQSSFSPKQERKDIADFTYMTDKYIKFDVSGYVDSLVKDINKDINEEIERRLAEIGFIKVVRCKGCKYYEGHFCKRVYIMVSDTDYCSRGERRDSNDTDTD